MTFYFDVTETLGLSLNSGIQRVVREMVGRSLTRLGPDAACPVIAIAGRFHRLTPVGRAALARTEGGEIWATSGKKPKAQYLKNVLRRIRPLFALARARRFRRGLRAMRDYHEVGPVRIGAGDAIVLLDSFWSGGSALRATATARRHGARVVVFVHDLFPIKHPDFVSRETGYAFPRAISKALALADAVIANSLQTQQEVREYRPELDASRMTHAYLGCGVVSAPDLARDEDALPVGLWRYESRLYLMVGTIEPRKGHVDALDGFEQLWAAGGDQTLVIVGKPGWSAEGLLARCHNHVEYGRKLFLIHNASDGALSRLMARCDALVIASWFEGFGLPLVEALAAGRPVIASDIPIFKEIAGEAALFFRSRDPTALAEAVRRHEADPAYSKARARAFSWISWDEAADRLAGELVRLLAIVGEPIEPPRRPAPSYGQRADPTNLLPG